MIVEFTRFRVLPGKEERAREWMAFLRANPEAFRETLEPERMYVETIFSEVVDGVMYLSWYSVQGEGEAADVRESAHWLDERHVAFGRECIDPDFAGQDVTPEVHVTPARVEASMRPLD